MSWATIENTDIYLQPDDTENVDATQETSAFALNFKGAYATLKTRLDALRKGDLIETGKYAQSWSLRRVAGNLGVLTINCVPPENSTTVDNVTSSDSFKEVWSQRSARNDVSILGYCGDSSSLASRAQIEAWMKEPDGDIAKGFEFKDSSGEIVTLGGLTLDVAKKIAKGVDSVIRFYAIVTKKSHYHLPPPECMKNLGFIDTPPAPPTGYEAVEEGGRVKKIRMAPNGLQTVISNRQWLKIQDDCDEEQGGWIRTESWWGIPKTTNNQTPWDEDLYGLNRWDMPYTGSSQQSSQAS